MISTWSEWKRYPRPGRGENLEAPISPGIYEVRIAGTGALYSFGAVDNLSQALALLRVGSKNWFGRRNPSLDRTDAGRGVDQRLIELAAVLADRGDLLP